MLIIQCKLDIKFYLQIVLNHETLKPNTDSKLYQDNSVSNINFQNHDFIRHYLLNNLNIIEKYFKGSLQKSIDDEDFNSIKIPIPSLEVQNKIVEYLDNKNKIIKDLEKEIDDIKNEAEEFMKNSLL